MRCVVLVFFLFACVVSAQPENPGPYAAGSSSVSVTRNGRQLQTTIYYPAVTAGSNTSPDTLRRPYPVIIFGHGFLTQVSWYTTLLKHLVSHGYIVLAPQFPDTQHGELADDMLYLLDWIHAENKKPASLYYKLADTLSTGVTGHSMGGGASLLAASRSRLIKLAAPMAPAETAPSAIAVMNQIRAVVYLIAGQNDGITPVATNQSPMYTSALPFKALNILKGGNHMRFMDNASFDLTDNRGYLTRPEQLRIARRYLTSVCNLILRGDTTYRQYLLASTTAADTQIIYSYQTGPVPPAPFAQVSPSGALAGNAVTFTWRASVPLVSGNTVSYVMRLSVSPSLRDSAAYYYYTNDTTLFISKVAAGTWYWQAVARTSDSTATASAAPMLIQVPPPAGIEGTTTRAAVTGVYPNPSLGDVTLLCGQGAVVRVYNTAGQKVYELSEAAGSVRIPKSAVPAGMYFYTVTKSGAVTAGKFVTVK